MTDDVYDVLSELHKYYFILRKDYCVDGKKDFLFYSKSGNLLNITSFNYELKKAVEKYNETAEYKIDKISAHTLRHTGCTRDAEDGMDIKVLQYIMGHSNTQITNNVYNHVNEERAASEDLYTNFTPIMCKDMWIYNRLREMTACRKIPANAEK